MSSRRSKKPRLFDIKTILDFAHQTFFLSSAHRNQSEFFLFLDDNKAPPLLPLPCASNPSVSKARRSLKKAKAARWSTLLPPPLALVHLTAPATPTDPLGVKSARWNHS
jgi:hypothetical protein